MVHKITLLQGQFTVYYSGSCDILYTSSDTLISMWCGSDKISIT